jgi:hypothetical protein
MENSTQKTLTDNSLRPPQRNENENGLMPNLKPSDNHQLPTRARNKYLNIMLMSHGIGQKDARAARRKYYLEEEVRNERLTEGGDFVLSGRSVPLHLSVPQARNFGIMFRCLF